MSRSPRLRFVPRFEWLEARETPTTFTVNDAGNKGDSDSKDGKPLTEDGKVTLRAVFDHINAVGGSHTIQFSGPMSIDASGGLILNRDGVTITGFDPGDPTATKINGGIFLRSNNKVSSVFITGGDIGLTVRNNSTISKVVVSGNSFGGICLNGSGNKLTSSIVGLESDAMTPLPNQGYGVLILGSSNTIGGSLVSEGNLMSGSSGNVISSNFTDGIRMLTFSGPQTSNRNVIIGNRIGVSIDGDTALPNKQWGVSIQGASNRVGGLASSEMNQVSAAKGGIGGVWIRALSSGHTGNKVQGNFIGTKADGNSMFTSEEASPGQSVGIFVDASNPLTHSIIQNNVVGDSDIGVYVNRGDASKMDGTQLVGNKIGVGSNSSSVIRNEIGVLVRRAVGLTIGGTSASNKNIISGNTQSGIQLTQDTTKTKIYGNYIGTNPSGDDRGNGENGIYISESSDNYIGSLTRTGKADTKQGNIIAFNGHKAEIDEDERGHAILIDSGTKNTIRGNSFHDNKAMSIYLTDSEHFNELPQNDVGKVQWNAAKQRNLLTTNYDADTGANDLLNIPVVKSVSGGQTTWQFIGKPKQSFVVDFYSDPDVNELGHGTGKEYLGFLSFQTDDIGLKQFKFAAGTNVSAVVTDSEGNTSPFSLVDADGDGLADGWETHGIDFDMDGKVDQKLLGANPARRDLYLEIDVMTGVIPAGVNIQDVFADLEQAFDAAPGGISLHINPDMAASALPFDDRYDQVWNDMQAAKKSNFGNGDPSSAAYKAREMAYRYVIFANRYTLGSERFSSGLSELTVVNYPTGNKSVSFGGNENLITVPAEFFVGDGGSPSGHQTVTKDDLAGTLMHELGHNLGLRHGGGDDVTFKPNQYSLMNYTWQMPGFLFRIGAADADYTSSWTGLDYARQKFAPSLNETAVRESTLQIMGKAGGFVPVGVNYWSNVGGGSWAYNGKRVMYHVMPQTGFEFVNPGGTPFNDFLRNNAFDKGSYVIDLNNDGGAASRSPLISYDNEWQMLDFHFRESPAYAATGSVHGHGLSVDDYQGGRLAAEVFVLGADAGSEPRVQVYGPENVLERDFLAFDAGFTGGVRVAKGDVTGDGTLDYITAMGPGGGEVRVFDGTSGSLVWSAKPFGDGFLGGLNVAAGDTTGDGTAEVFVAPATGVGGTVKILDAATGASIKDIAAFGATTKTGLVIAGGDVNGDGKADLVIAPAAGANPAVKIFNASGKMIKSFTASSSAFNGVHVAVGDINGDGFGDIIVGAGAGTTSKHLPLVRVYSGAKPSTIIHSFIAHESNAFLGGIRVAALKLAGGEYEIVTATGSGGRTVTRFNGARMFVPWQTDAFDAGFSGVFVG